MLLILLLLILTACSGGGGSSAPATFDVSGTVFAAAGNEIDSDVNDANTTPVDNNSFDAAQTITAPAALGGYVNVAGAGPDGNSKAAGDTSDFFQVELTSGQSVRFSLPVTASADLELHIYDSARALVDSLVGVGRTGVLTVAQNDIYFIEVRAVSGAASYKLIVGDAAALSASRTGMQLSHEFVPGQAIVRWRAGAAPAAGSDRLAMTTAATMGGKRFQLMQFDTEEQVGAVFGRLQVGDASRAARAMPHADPLMQRKYDTLKIIQALRQRDDVEMAAPNYIRRAHLVPTDPQYIEQWHYRNIDLEAAWDITTGDPGVIVAVIDSGVLLSHPDLSGRLVTGYDFISNETTANDGDGADPDPDDPGDEIGGNSSFHGTHVTGTVVAVLNNGVGGTGVAPTASVMPIRALGIGGGTDADIINGIDYAAGLEVELADETVVQAAQPAQIINMSLGGPAPSQPLDAAILRARSQGLIIVASAGNSASSSEEFPAASPGVIAVAATDLNDQRAVYSSFGATIDVAAPGGDRGVNLDGIAADDGVLSTSGSDADTTVPIQLIYSSQMGTSMSSPHLAGVVALMKSVRPGLTPDEMDAYLASGTITDAMGDSGMGAGLINALKAVTQAGLPDSPTALSATPNAVNFGTSSGGAVVTLTKVGGGALSVTSVTSDAAWLTVVDQVPDADNLGGYTVSVDRFHPDVTDGINTATITAVSTVNTVQVPIRLEVLPDRDADAGFQYALLINASTRTLADEVEMTFAAGVYSFSFTGILDGTYQIFTGTDLDNDGLNLDAGEAFGAYPSAVAPLTLDVRSNMPGLSFTTGFSLDFFVSSNQFATE